MLSIGCSGRESQALVTSARPASPSHSGAGPLKRASPFPAWGASTLHDRRNRHEELSRSEGGKTVTQIEGFGLLVFGVDDKGEYPHVGPRGPQGCVRKKRRRKLPTLVVLIHSQAANACDRHQGIARQTAFQLIGKQVERQA